MVYLRLKPIIPPGPTSHGKYFQLDRSSIQQANVNIWIWNMKITSSGLDIFPIGSRWGRVAWSRLPRCGALDKVLGGGEEMGCEMVQVQAGVCWPDTSLGRKYFSSYARQHTYQHRYLGLTTAQLGSAQHQIIMILHTDFLELYNVHLKLPLVLSDKLTAHWILVWFNGFNENACL